MGMKNCLKLPARVCSGQGTAGELKNLAQGKKRTIVLTDEGVASTGLAELAAGEIKGKGTEILTIPLGEPSCRTVDEITKQVESLGAEAIAAVGGGSVMDTAKLAALLANSGHSIYELLDNPEKIKERKIHLTMLPTTAGTGAEATPNGIVSVPDKEIKVGIVNDALIADEVILDARLVRDLPPHILAATGIDALCHALECYTSQKANVFSDTFALDALEKIMKNLERAYMDAQDLEAKEQLLIAAFYGGVAISSSGTTAVHALSYPLGGRYHIPHGIANAVLLKPVLRFNEPVIRPWLAAAGKRLFPEGKEEKELADRFMESVEVLLENLSIPSDLKRYGIRMADLDELTDGGMECKRLLDNNRRTLTREDAEAIYRQVM